MHHRKSEKTWTERMLQALGFELLAIVICAPIMGRVLATPVLDTGALTVMFSTIALLWNVVFNLLFDGMLARLQQPRTLLVRVIHALTFEGGLVVILVPVGAWWLAINLWEALWIDIGLLLFFLPYTFVFNWMYDTLRDVIARRRHNGETVSTGT